MWVLLLFSFFLLMALVIFLVTLSSLLGFVLTRVPFVPTAARDIRAIVARVPLTQEDIIYDLGSGNGKVAFMLSDLTGARTTGFEMTLWTHWYARIKQLLTRSPARFVRGDFFKRDWSGASVIYCYLYPPLMRQIGDKALAECRPGTRIIVRDFPIKHLSPIDHFHTYGKHEIFVYKI
jgi:hypothetical protein